MRSLLGCKSRQLNGSKRLFTKRCRLRKRHDPCGPSAPSSAIRWTPRWAAQSRAVNDITNLFTATDRKSSRRLDYSRSFNPATGNCERSNQVQCIRHKSNGGQHFTMNPGLGSPCITTTSATVPTVFTFVGQVEQGTYNVAMFLPKARCTMLGSPVPIGGDMTNSTTAIGLVPHSGDYA